MATGWRTWLLFVFTANDAVAQALTDDELKVAICRRSDLNDAAPDLLALLIELKASHYGAAVREEYEDRVEAAIAKAEAR